MARTHTPRRPARAPAADVTTDTEGATRRKRNHSTGARPDARPSARPDAGKARPPRYDFAAFEQRWRAEWEARGIYRVNLDDAPRPFYNLMMFPYPSAEGLHVGNVYAYVGSDIQGRLMAMRGYDVFEPMGFDAFGIHSENFAIKRGVHPAELTAHNVERFREEQLKRIGNRFDWSHEVNTTDPAYYRWTQWIFIQLFKMGLAERKTGIVNWCPNDKTVLADEQVIDGHCERCGALVERRDLPHWALRITAYADRLLNNLDTLDWSERVKAAQRHWIGRSTGVEFALAIAGYPDARVEVFTTRPDTVFGVTFVVLAPEHPLAERIATPERRDAIAAYRAGAATRRAEREQARDANSGGSPAEDAAPAGVFTGTYAIHPITGEQIPIWVADYVLIGYGSGAIMAVPAHDERDWLFAHTMGLPVRFVVRPDGQTSESAASESAAPGAPYIGEGALALSGEFTGQSSHEARDAITAWFEARQIGRRITRYHLRDWLISRQRYWGPPIPIIYCPDHGAVAVPDDQLPVRLPDLENYQPQGTGDSPLARVASFVNTTCPVCGKPATRDTDVMDNFLDSSWYYLRYPSSDDDARAWNPERTRKWLPVDLYVGGAEHSVLHLLYARFIVMAIHDAGLLDFEEPFKRFRAHGMITLNGAKISKSKGNVVNPDDYITAYGADALRIYLMFMGPYELGGDFSDRGIAGVVRFLERVWRIGVERGSTLSDAAPSVEARRALHQAIRKVSDDTAAFKYNTAIAELMRYSGDLETRDAITREEAQTLLRLLAPYAPYITEELWRQVGGAGFIHQHPWPEADDAAMRAETATVIAQVNGKLRARLTLPTGATQEEALAAALASESVRRALGGAEPRQVIFIPARLINLVTGS
ncbi:MAG TPA: leucine--tRNA ligase [Ktedonobacterales bacterium]|nr:leucine--tRNA ligase [Ktedonobacterales bacterium]